MATSDAGTAGQAEGGNDSTSSGATPAAEEFTPITSQEDLNAALKDRLARERAKFGDYKDLQAKAAKLDELEAANRSDLEKATDRVTAAETERDAAKAEAMRLRIAVEHEISIEDADLFLTGTDEETLKAQAERLATRNEASAKPRAPKPDHNQGRQSDGSASTADQFAATVGGLL